MPLKLRCHLTCKDANKCVNVYEPGEVVERNKKMVWSPPFPCCPANRQCMWKKTLIAKKIEQWMALKRLPHQRPILRILMSPLPQNDLYETGYSITSVRSRDLKNSMKTRTTSTILGEQEELDAGMWRVTITALLGHMTWKIVKLHIGQLIWSSSLNSTKT